MTTTTTKCAYELEREARIAANDAFFKTLGLDNTKKKTVAKGAGRPRAVREVLVARRSSRISGEGVQDVEEVQRQHRVVVRKRLKRSIVPVPEARRALLDEAALSGFEKWLKESGGKDGGPISGANVAKVMLVVNGLMSGEGVSYISWPEPFYKDQKITIRTDFMSLSQSIVDHAIAQGDPTNGSNGWFTTHPIHKLHAYQAYLLSTLNDENAIPDADQQTPLPPSTAVSSDDLAGIAPN